MHQSYPDPNYLDPDYPDSGFFDQEVASRIPDIIASNQALATRQF
jgi:hypothetical protein